MENANESIIRRLGLTALILTALYAITYGFFKIFYEDGDDIFMQLIAQGGMSGKPDEHLVFINILIGYFLKTLYQWHNGIYWYSGFMLMLQVLALSIILSHLLQKKIKWYFYVPILLFFQYFIIRVQFTSIAGLLNLAGYIILGKAYISRNNLQYLAAILLFVLSSLIRFEMFLLTSAVFLMIFVLDHRQNIFRIKSNLRFPAYFILAFALIFSARAYHQSKYSETSEWVYYRDFNLARGKVNDNPNLDRYVESIKKSDPEKYAGLKLVAHFIYPESYDTAAFTALRQEIRPDFKSMVINNINAFHSAYLLSGALFLLLLAGVLLYAGKFWYMLPISAVIFLTIYLNFESYMKPRLLFPLVFGIFILIMGKLTMHQRLIVAVYTTLMLIVLNGRYIELAKPQYPDNEHFSNSKTIVALVDPGFASHPFDLDKYDRHSNIIYHGWLSNFPPIISNLRSRGIPVNQNLALVDDDLLAKNVEFYCGNPKLFNNYLAYHHKKLVAAGSENFYKIVHDSLQQTPPDR